ncbi:hypothetical protein MT_57024 [Pseudomonas phage phiPto-bp6g]|nr:hypothetical protein MT_57024 [Pseudomonas phage phiPto-bp6g]
MKVELSNKTKTNLKAAMVTTLVVFVIVFLLTMVAKYTVEFIALIILLISFGSIGFGIFMTFSGVRDMLVERQEKKEAEERSRAKGY